MQVLEEEPSDYGGHTLKMLYEQEARAISMVKVKPMKKRIDGNGSPRFISFDQPLCHITYKK